MNRRQFIALSGAASLAAVAPSTSSAQGSSDREYYELLQVSFENDEQKKAIDAFLKDAAIPGLNRIGCKPVGVFYPEKGPSPLYVLIPHKNLESVATRDQRLSEDNEFISAGNEFLNAPASAPAFKRIESSLLLAFTGMPRIETPVKNPERVFQLRTYESPSVVTGLKKIEMFNDAGEIKLFREVGLNPVFFGQTLVGAKIPCLTYMLGFKDADAQKAAWGKFGAHPEWKRLSKMPEYADKNILSGITNISVKPSPYSQV